MGNDVIETVEKILAHIKKNSDYTEYTGKNRTPCFFMVGSVLRAARRKHGIEITALDDKTTITIKAEKGVFRGQCAEITIRDFIPLLEKNFMPKGVKFDPNKSQTDLLAGLKKRQKKERSVKINTPYGIGNSLNIV